MHDLQKWEDNKVKKIILATLISSFFVLNVSASPMVEITDAANDIIAIKGDAAYGQSVSLFVLNPGFELSTITSDGALQFFDKKYVDDTGYTFNIGIKNISDGGVFTAVVNNDGVQEIVPFSFYPVSVKMRYIEDINKSDSYENLVEIVKEREGADTDVMLKIYSAFSLDTDQIFQKLTKDSIGKSLFNIKTYSNDGRPFEYDADKMLSALKRALVLAAFNSGAVELIQSDGKITKDIASILDIPNDEFLDYQLNLNNNGIKAVNSSLFARKYNAPENITELFCDELYYRIIMNYKESGWGHIPTYLEKYKSYYKSKGFLLDKINEIKSPADFYADLLNSGASNISELSEYFNGLLSKNTSNSNNTSKGGGGVSSGGNFVSSTPNPGLTELPPAIDKVFSDIADVEWAHKAIEELYNAGAINGKTNNIFAPNDSVTRAEFVKMLALALNFEESTVDVSFDDIENHWCKPYILTVAALHIANGVSETEFMPDIEITREQGAVFLYRAAQNKAVKLEGVSTVFTDENEISSYAKEAIYKLSGSGIINGKGDNIFAPKDQMTRAEAAKLIYGLTKLCK